MHMNKIFSYFFLLLCAVSVAQQDPQYSMYMFNQLAINPAYAGSKNAISTTLIARNQWTTFIGSPKTSVVSIHAPIRKKFIGLGGYVYAETLGPKKTTGAYGTYCYRKDIGNGHLAIGIGTGILNYNFNWNAINFKDQGDINTYYQTNNKTVFDFSAGLYYHDNSFYAGLSMTHLNGAVLFEHISTDSTDFFADYRLKRHIFLTLGKGFKVNDDLIINPSAVVKYYGTNMPSVDLNFNLNLKKKIWTGISYRFSYGMVLLTQYNVTNHFKIGYSVDAGRNRIGRAGGLSHEILIGYNFDIYHAKMVSPRFL